LSLTVTMRWRPTVSDMTNNPTKPEFDFGHEAELFSMKNRKPGKTSTQYRRFSRAAEAVRFAVEELPSEAFYRVHIEVDEQRYDSKEIRRLYESA
jgi:hypothetical protein